MANEFRSRTDSLAMVVALARERSLALFWPVLHYDVGFSAICQWPCVVDIH